MRRRDLILAFAATPLFVSSLASAQSSGRVFRVGMLWHAGSAEEEGNYFIAVTKGFEALGYVEGRNLKLEHRYADEQYDRFEAQAAELAAMDIPIQQPTNLEFRVNLRSATEAGIEIRQSVIDRADVVIE